MKSILDSSFQYTPSTETNLRRTFMRLRREQLKTAISRGQPKDNVNVLFMKRLQTCDSKKT
jgi:hypothetical protein